MFDSTGRNVSIQRIITWALEPSRQNALACRSNRWSPRIAAAIWPSVGYSISAVKWCTGGLATGCLDMRSRSEQRVKENPYKSPPLSTRQSADGRPSANDRSKAAGFGIVVFYLCWISLSLGCLSLASTLPLAVLGQYGGRKAGSAGLFAAILIPSVIVALKAEHWYLSAGSRQRAKAWIFLVLGSAALLAMAVFFRG